MPDSPVYAKRLSEEERIAVLERVRDDQGGTENKKLKLEQIKEAITDVRTWLIALTTIMSAFLLGLLFMLATKPDLYTYIVASIPNGALSNCKFADRFFSIDLTQVFGSQQHYHQEFWLYVGISKALRRVDTLLIYVMNSSKQTLILSTPGGVVAAVTTLACGYWSDKKVSL